MSTRAISPDAGQGSCELDFFLLDIGGGDWLEIGSMRPGAAVAFLLVTTPPGSGVQAATNYAADVDFLLAQFESGAAPLLKIKGIDWAAVSAEFRAAAQQTKTEEEHLQLVGRLLGKLNDGHAAIVKSEVKRPDESKGRRYTGPRVALAAAPDRVWVRAAFKDAADAGLHAGQEVTRIDGVPASLWLAKKAESMRDRGQGFSTPQMALYSACHWGLADFEGTRIRFEIKDADGGLKTIERVRNGGPNYAPIGPLFPPDALQHIGRQSFGRTAHGFGYIHLRDVPDQLPAQIRQMLPAIGNVPGLILDVRANGGGGCDHAAVFACFLAKNQKWRGYGSRVDGGFAGPMVVIIDAGVRSAGETIAGMFKEDGRAYVIGESATAGMSSQKKEIRTPSGLFTIRFSIASNKERFNQGRGIEGIGVPPHEIVDLVADDLLHNRDTLIERAAQLLREGLPKGVVPYAAPSPQP